MVGIAIGDFPEECAIGLGLDFRHCEVGCFLKACSGGTVAFRAVSLEEFGAACCGVFVFGERILAGCRLIGRAPGGVLFVARVLRASRHAEEHRRR